MTGIIVTFLVVFILVWMLTNNKVIGSIIWSIIMTSFLLWFTFGLWGYDRDISEEYQVPCDDIYSLNISTEVHGSFVLGFGSVGSETYYTFYTKDSNDLYKMSKVGVNRTLIKLDSSQSPKMVKVVQLISSTPCTIFGGNKSSHEYDTGKRILVVPSNTIRQEYKVN